MVWLCSGVWQGVRVWVACGRIKGARNKAREGVACGPLLGVHGPAGVAASSEVTCCPPLAGWVHQVDQLPVLLVLCLCQRWRGRGRGHGRARLQGVPGAGRGAPLPVRAGLGAATTSPRAASRNCFSRVSQRALLGTRGDTARGVLLSAC